MRSLFAHKNELYIIILLRQLTDMIKPLLLLQSNIINIERFGKNELFRMAYIIMDLQEEDSLQNQNIISVFIQ